MAVNKVVYGNNTIIDLTGDTATAADVAQGKTFHLASGVQAVGTASTSSSSVLYFTSIACSATTGDFATVSDSAITADHVVAECVFANPSNITTEVVNWTTSSGSLVLNGTCSSATTANVLLIKKDN